MLMVSEKKIDPALEAWALALADREWGPPRPRVVEPEDDVPTPLITDTWYVLATETQQEAAAAAGLIGRRIPAYCPQHPKSIRQNYHKRRTVMRPMLVGYILTGWDGSAKQWNRIHGVAGVRRLLQVNDRPVPVPEAALTYLRTKEAEAMANFGKRKRAPIGCKVGDWVQIVEHFSFTGLLGHVVAILDKQDRITLEVGFFGRLTRVDVSAQQVRSI